MTKLIIHLSKKRAVRMKKHLEEEHPSTRGKMEISGIPKKRNKKRKYIRQPIDFMMRMR
jgi:hypothetical protein